MNKRAYELANEIGMDAETDVLCGMQGLPDKVLRKEEIEKYQKVVLEKQKEQKRSRRIIAAACAAAFLGSMAIFGEEVHAEITRIGWSISSALRISEDIAKYCDVVNTSVTDVGYVITLQEAVAAEDKLIVTYTLQREDGKPMEEVRVPEARLFINGTEIRNGVYGSADFINEVDTVSAEHTTVGIVSVYDIVDIDMAKENSYQLTFNKIDSQTKGEWDFRFTADGTDLEADSVRIPLQKEFVINEKADIVLEELVLNRLEQKISFHIDGPSSYVISNYDLQVTAEDRDGHIVRFEVRRLDGVSGSGYMLNNTHLAAGWIDEDVDMLTLTFSVKKMVKENGQLSLGDTLLEESFRVEFP